MILRKGTKQAELFNKIVFLLLHRIYFRIDVERVVIVRHQSCLEI